MKRVLRSMLLLALIALPAGATAQSGLVVRSQVSGYGQTNTYLLYDPISREAALFDVGGPIDTLEEVIRREALQVRYLLVTHAHADHVAGIPAIRTRFGSAALCLSAEEWEETRNYAQWRTKLDSSAVAEILQDSAGTTLMNFDFALLGTPDIKVRDGSTFRLGNHSIRAMLCPGHAVGSVCFYTEGKLFSGDVLFYRTVGRADLPGAGSRAASITSVRRLYTELPDSTIVYPGHGRHTDIASEKRDNKRISANGGSWDQR